MSALAAILPTMRRPQASTHQPQQDQLADLRFALEVMPGSRKYVFTPAARAEILAKLYSSFMGNHPHLFLGGSGKLPQYMLLSEYQASVAATAPVTWKEKAEAVIPGRPCTYIFKKGECCFRCKCVSPVVSSMCVLLTVLSKGLFARRQLCALCKMFSCYRSLRSQRELLHRSTTRRNLRLWRRRGLAELTRLSPSSPITLPRRTSRGFQSWSPRRITAYASRYPSRSKLSFPCSNP